MNRGKNIKKLAVICLAGMTALALASCAGDTDPGKNLLMSEEENDRIVDLFSPMEKMEPDAENVARSATDKTVILAEEQLGVKVGYITYTAEN